MYVIFKTKSERLITMIELKELICRIEEMKKFLYNIVELKQDLLDPDVIAASKLLDTALNEYNDLIKANDQTHQ